MMQSREDEVADCDLVFLDRGAYSIKIYEKVFGMEDLSALHDEIDRMSRSYKLVYVFHPGDVLEALRHQEMGPALVF